MTSGTTCRKQMKVPAPICPSCSLEKNAIDTKLWIVLCACYF